MHVRDATNDDRQAIAKVVAAAFGQPDEARLVEALRDGGEVQLELVAIAGEQIVGQVLFSQLRFEPPAPGASALALAPLAVEPARQGQGIGTELVEEGLKRARQLGHALVIVVGSPAYYGRFGFSLDEARRFQSVYSGPHFQALRLSTAAEALGGRQVIYPAPFQGF